MPAKESPSGIDREIHFKSCRRNVHDVATLYMIREAIRDLSKFLERYPNVTRINREDYFLFALRRIQVLKSELIPLNTVAFMESVQLSVNILGFRECLDEKYSELAKANLEKIGQLLCVNK